MKAPAINPQEETSTRHGLVQEIDVSLDVNGEVEKELAQESAALEDRPAVEEMNDCIASEAPYEPRLPTPRPIVSPLQVSFYFLIND